MRRRFAHTASMSTAEHRPDRTVPSGSGVGAKAALALTKKRFLANVTLEEVGRVAFVSPRTVSNYISFKEEAVVAAGSEFTGLLEQSSRPWRHELGLTSPSMMLVLPAVRSSTPLR